MPLLNIILHRSVAVSHQVLARENFYGPKLFHKPRYIKFKDRHSTTFILCWPSIKLTIGNHRTKRSENKFLFHSQEYSKARIYNFIFYNNLDLIIIHFTALEFPLLPPTNLLTLTSHLSRGLDGSRGFGHFLHGFLSLGRRLTFPDLLGYWNIKTC